MIWPPVGRGLAPNHEPPCSSLAAISHAPTIRRNPGWRSLKGLESDKTGPMPSYERVLAGAALHRINPSLLLIPSGGASNLDATGEAPSIASVMANELYELGIPSPSVF